MNPHNSYADDIAATKVMLSGLKANTDKLSKWGMDSEHLTNFEGIYNEVLNLDNEQEALKSRLKEKTALLNEKVAVMNKLYSNSKKVVKIQMPKESWKEFGIDDVK
ncbi:MAG: hypothetical protein ACM3X9_00645 [Bacillota bacterium]